MTGKPMTARDWERHIGWRVIFRYFDDEEATGEVSSVNGRFVFVRFGLSGVGVACDPSQLRLEVPV